MTITNPERECKTTPATFSGESKITHLETTDYRRGIILDNLDEVMGALRVYSGGSVVGSMATQHDLMNTVGNRGGGMGALLLLMGKRDGSSFTERLTQNVIFGLKSNGRFYQHFDYDGEGTFFKTSVEVEKVGDKYVLGLNAAYVGTQPEDKLAEKIEKPLALVRSSVNAKLSVVDGWWFNLNLEDVLGSLAIPKKEVRQWSEYLESERDSSKRPETIFKHQRRKFSLDIALNADHFLRPNNGEPGSEYMQRRGKNIVGGAWTTWAENGNDKCVPRVVQPAVVVSVSLLGERYFKPVAVTEDQIKAVLTARDYLADSMRAK